MLWGIIAGLPDSRSHVHLGIKQNYFKNKIDAERQQKKKKIDPESLEVVLPYRENKINKNYCFLYS
jgi:hypothetical protein